jgi:hypothetical protein
MKLEWEDLNGFVLAQPKKHLDFTVPVAVALLNQETL